MPKRSHVLASVKSYDHMYTFFSLYLFERSRIFWFELNDYCLEIVQNLQKAVIYTLKAASKLFTTKLFSSTTELIFATGNIPNLHISL
jgi:hypothetical protein